ncbi:MAG: tRNA-dihydrouridine synthase [Bacteroidales bacterium]|jgi:nifR3 family TIM-barrel protein|nr:tRNA-dihydrouridine synthase [Bacteroidales bacterium]
MQTTNKLTFLPEFSLWLAPMESVTDKVFRMLCKRAGADVLVSEFVSSEALIRERVSSMNKMSVSDSERPIGIQIFGHDENSMRAAAEIAAREKPDFIDINWGCPVNKIVKKGAGSGILRDIPKMLRITEAVVKAMDNLSSGAIPVTVKTRLGWDENSKPIVEIAERLQDIGISGISIHGRTRSQLYAGNADWTLIGEVKNNPRMYIPVFGNGDIDSAEKALLMHERYGVDGVLIGRAAIGNPWVFGHSTPTVQERAATLLEHLKAEIDMRCNEPLTKEITEQERLTRAERISCNEIKIHYSGYFRGIQGFKPFKIRLMQTSSLQEAEAILSEFISTQL